MFLKHDSRLGYHQLRIKEEVILKNTYRTRYSHYEFMLMSIELTNATATFMSLINKVFST